MTDYTKSKMYKIVCRDESINEIYVGSTTTYFARRRKHISMCRLNKSQCKLYVYMRENGGFDNFKMVIIEKYECDSREAKLAREAYWVKTLKATLNSEVPGRTHKQYRIDNKDKINKYRKDNRDKETARRSVKVDCPICGGCYQIYNKAKHYKTKKHKEFTINWTDTS